MTNSEGAPAGTAAPGWYPDPRRPQLRWWNGHAWTSHVQPQTLHTQDAENPHRIEIYSAAEPPIHIVSAGSAAGAGSAGQRNTLLFLHTVRRYFIRGWKGALMEIVAVFFLVVFAMSFLLLTAKLVAGRDSSVLMIAIDVLGIAGVSAFLVHRSRRYVVADPKGLDLGSRSHRRRMMFLLGGTSIIAVIWAAAIWGSSQPSLNGAELEDLLRSNLTAAPGSGTDVNSVACASRQYIDGDVARCVFDTPAGIESMDVIIFRIDGGWRLSLAK
ncbi:DUF2510 domain-containing protein [Rhodococcus qingshengii]|uniref:DUF2510 domain-containing protein n=1 Tax=Rhodococcus qingshengii TaxID=334542 RepID=UPI003D2BAB65